MTTCTQTDAVATWGVATRPPTSMPSQEVI
jgi:hypothetical protein